VPVFRTEDQVGRTQSIIKGIWARCGPCEYHQQKTCCMDCVVFYLNIGIKAPQIGMFFHRFSDILGKSVMTGRPLAEKS
jgi:hypothetical protein